MPTKPLPPVIEGALRLAWQAMFDAKSPLYVLKLLQDSLGTVTNEPSNPDVSGSKGFDLGSGIPDILGMLTFGATPMGNAQAFLKRASISGFTTLTPREDDQHKKGISFGDYTGATLELTGQVIATKIQVADGSWEIHQEEVLYPGGGCGSGRMLRTAGLEDSQDNMDLLRKFRTDLQERGGPMGKWYVERYTSTQQGVSALLDMPEWKAAVEQYNGNAVWSAILQAISSSQGGRPVAFPTALGGHAIALVTAAQTLTKDPHLEQTISEILDYVGEYIDGNTYDEILAIIASQRPPARVVVPPKAIGFVEPVFGMQRWSGGFTAETQKATATATFVAHFKDDHTAPTVECKEFKMDVPDAGWSFNITGSDFSSKFLLWLANTFKPSLLGSLNRTIVDKINPAPAGKPVNATNESIKKTIADQLNAAIASFWKH